MAVSGCVRKFLGQIREPVIPYSYGKEICGLLDVEDEDQSWLSRVVEDLPVVGQFCDIKKCLSITMIN